MRAAIPFSDRSGWVVMTLAIACGLSFSLLVPPADTGPELEWLGTPRPVSAFTLMSADGDFTADSLRGHWQLLALGFTHCPDLCPTTLSQLADLSAAVPGPRLRVVFVSVDPQRDSPHRLAAYTDYFGARFIGVTGADTQLHQLARSLGMDFRRDGQADSPIISHSPTIALIGPDGTLRGRLRPGFVTQKAARELTARIRAAS